MPETNDNFVDALTLRWNRDPSRFLRPQPHPALNQILPATSPDMLWIRSENVSGVRNVPHLSETCLKKMEKRWTRAMVTIFFKFLGWACPPIPVSLSSRNLTASEHLPAPLFQGFTLFSFLSFFTFLDSKTFFTCPPTKIQTLDVRTARHRRWSQSIPA